MRLSELMDLLQEQEERTQGADPEVRLVCQPAWPLQFEIRGVWVNNEDMDDPESVVYIVQGDHPHDTPYGSGKAWAE